MSVITIKWKKSTIGYPKKQSRIIRALGFKRLNQELEKHDTPIIRGMVHKVRHLIEVK
ncbi:MAG: 50S ribosomal protein L30 [SAR202 cluster bacterium]|nr:50S ribosomal protein L30 [SAR202 cluster bacterium]